MEIYLWLGVRSSTVSVPIGFKIDIEATGNDVSTKEKHLHMETNGKPGPKVHDTVLSLKQSLVRLSQTQITLQKVRSLFIG